MERKPEGLDWERWCGPGPKVAWNPGIYFSPYKWLHYDGGMIMGIGIHVIDSAHQFLRLSKAKAAVAGGGVYQFRDGRDTPDTVNLILEYPQDLNVTFEAEIMTVGWDRTPEYSSKARGECSRCCATTASWVTSMCRIPRTARRRPRGRQEIRPTPGG